MLGKYLKTHWLLITAGGVLGLMWSWLLFVDVAILSSSPFMGRFLSGVGFVTIWGLSWLLFWRAIRFVVTQKVRSWKTLILFVLVWAAVEFLVAWLVTVIWMGRDGSVDSVLPFGSFTPLLMYTPLGYLSRLVGYHGLSAVFVLCLVVLMRKDLKIYRAPVIGTVAVLTLCFWISHTHANGQALTATIVAEQLGDTQVIDQGQSQLVVLPEYGLDRYTAETVRTRFASDREVDFVGSQQQSDNGTDVRNIFVHGTTSGFIDRQDKTRLIPAGEYLPYAVEWFLDGWPGGRDILYTFQVRRAVVKGHDQLKPVTLTDGTVVGAAVCSSIISTKDYQQLARAGAEVFTNSASLEIFNGSRVFSMQHKGMSKFMAVANARAFLQSSNDGRAFAVDHNGNVIKSIQPVDSAQVTVQTNSVKTPYTYLGEWMSWLGGGLLVLAVLKWFRSKYQTRTDAAKKLK